MAVTKKIFIIAGEASGDRLGASLMSSLRHIAAGATLDISGIGGEWMRREGLTSFFPMEELSLMGFVEILPHIPRLKRRIAQTVAEIENTQPDIVVTIDSPGFTYRVVRQLRENGSMPNTRFVHYVAPTVWAYKPKRAAKTAKLFDALLTLLPFEPPFFEAEGLETHFVGHPIATEAVPNEAEIKDVRQQYDINDEMPVIVAYAGSRTGEVERLLPVYEQVFDGFWERVPHKIVLSTTAAQEERVKRMTANWKNTPLILSDETEKKAILHGAYAVLAKSGTVALEVARAGVPMVTTHKVNPASAWLVRRMLRTDYVNLINILHNRQVIEECIQERCTAEVLSKAMNDITQFDDIRKKQQHAMAQAMEMLASPHPHRAAEVVLADG